VQPLDRLSGYRRSLRDVTKTGFLANSEKQDAAIRRIEIIGEAAASVAQGSPFKPCGFSRYLFFSMVSMQSLRHRFLGGTEKEIEEPQGYSANPALHA
jgi:uncharacterized protein with HEPN domain